MLKKLSVLLLVGSILKVDLSACTGISLKLDNKQIIQARTIEWSENYLNSEIVILPRNKEYVSHMPNGKLGYKWKGKYGVVGASVQDSSIIGEGLNEKGLNAGVFFFPGYGKLEPFTGKNLNKSINDMDLVRWILTNFSTVDEVKKEIFKLKIVPIIIQNGVPSPTGHWRVGDKNGNNIVIEIINNGEIKIYDNPVGVLTNSPNFDWHLTNLNNYVNLRKSKDKAFKLGGQNIFPLGAGTGFLGLPGDVTPPSRFVRAAFYANNLPILLSNEAGIEQAFHILNNFDIPIGISYENRENIPRELPSATQWTTAVNLNEQKFYYKTMYNQNIRMIDLTKIDFEKVKEQILPMDKEKVQPVEEIIID
ncbi:choloylglycine hydrolase family protein [uncultured Cetobacterium sp.]|uniref:choloylglycine hydrolase family protein n=1 Tax=uncultured Cetobacterium sp. TaxID=527638 RepID=UPI002613CB9E|nr:choloylglycine hydrolase family protein [uncultured Cetobacterium sp.]